MCSNCEKNHSNHKIITYGSIIPETKKIKEQANSFNNKKEELKNEIKEIINKLNNLMNIFDNYFGIYQNINNNCENKNKNYFLIQNINGMIEYTDNRKIFFCFRKRQSPSASARTPIPCSNKFFQSKPPHGHFCILN